MAEGPRAAPRPRSSPSNLGLVLHLAPDCLVLHLSSLVLV